MYKRFVNNCYSITLNINFFVAHLNQVGIWFNVYFLCCSIPVQTIFEAHPNGCAAIAMSPDAKYIATISSTLPQVISKPTCPKWITKRNFGKISAQPPLTVVKQSLSIKSNLLLLPLFSFSQYCMCKEVYNGCVEILPYLHLLTHKLSLTLLIIVVRRILAPYVPSIWPKLPTSSLQFSGMAANREILSYEVQIFVHDLWQFHSFTLRTNY